MSVDPASVGWSPQDLLDIHGEAMTRARDLVLAKSHDYSSEADCFHNFRLVEELGLCSLPVGIVVRMADKLGRISTLLKNPAKVSSERMEDTLLDLINYAVFLYALFREPSIPAE